jgi:hypothetical protein
LGGFTGKDYFSVHCGTSPKANEEGIEQHYYKVEHSGGTRLGRNSNNSNTDVIFRKDNISPLRGSGFGHSAFLQIRRSEFAKKVEGEKNCG